MALCSTCGNAVAAGATCVVDGTIAPGSSEFVTSAAALELEEALPVGDAEYRRTGAAPTPPPPQPRKPAKVAVVAKKKAR